MTRPLGRILLGATLSITLVLGCGKDSTGPTPVVVTIARVDVTPTAATLIAFGATAQLSAVAKDASGAAITGKTYTWTSSLQSVATVDASGLVTAVAGGSATISATVEGKSGSAAVQVSQAVATVAIAGTRDSLDALGDTTRYGATAKDARGNVIAGATVSWTSSAPAVATVQGTGLITAVANGTATIQAQVDTVIAQRAFTVQQVVRSIRATGALDSVGALGDTVRFVADALDGRSNPVLNQSYRWSTADVTVASIDSSTGLARAVGNGRTAILARVLGVPGVSGSDSLIVRQNATTVLVSTTRDTLKALGDTVRFAAEARDARNNAIPAQAFRWSILTPSVASIDSLSGLARALTNGRTTVLARLVGTSGATGTDTLVVNQVVESVVVSAARDTLTAISDTVTLTPTAKDANGQPVSTATFTWHTDNASVATVSAAGRVTAVGQGIATVFATAAGVEGSRAIAVVQVPSSIVVTPAVDTVVALGDTVRFQATVQDRNGYVVANAKVAWSTSSTPVATIDTLGLATGLATGTATVTARFGGQSGAGQVIVQGDAVMARGGISLPTAAQVQLSSLTVRTETGSATIRPDGTFDASVPADTFPHVLFFTLPDSSTSLVVVRLPGDTSRLSLNDTTLALSLVLLHPALGGAEPSDFIRLRGLAPTQSAFSLLVTRVDALLVAGSSLAGDSLLWDLAGQVIQSAVGGPAPSSRHLAPSAGDPDPVLSRDINGTWGVTNPRPVYLGLETANPQTSTTSFTLIRPAQSHWHFGWPAYTTDATLTNHGNLAVGPYDVILSDGNSRSDFFARANLEPLALNVMKALFKGIVAFGPRFVLDGPTEHCIQAAIANANPPVWSVVEQLANGYQVGSVSFVQLGAAIANVAWGCLPDQGWFAVTWKFAAQQLRFVGRLQAASELSAILGSMLLPLPAYRYALLENGDSRSGISVSGGAWFTSTPTSAAVTLGEYVAQQAPAGFLVLTSGSYDYSASLSGYSPLGGQVALANGRWTLVPLQFLGPLLTVSGIAPNSGPLAGGTPVTITGTDFVSPATATIGGVALTGLTVVSATQITGTTPASATAGARDVIVATGAGSGTCTGCFTYNPDGGSSPGTLVNGESHSGTIAASGELDTLTFTATQGNTIVLSVGRVSTGATLYPWIRLVSPTGAIVAENDSYNGVVYNPGAAQITISAPTSGTYTVIVGSNDPRTVSLGGLGYAGTGDYVLTLVTAPGALSISAGDEGGAMTNGATHTGTLRAGDLDPWTFTATQGNTIVLSVGRVSTGATLYPWIRLVSPTGAIVAENDSYNGVVYNPGAAQITISAPTGGTYTVIVGSNDPRTMSLGGLGYAGTGDYVLTLVTAPGEFNISAGDEGGAITNGATHTGTLPAGDLDPWTFAATQGNTIVLSVGRVSTGATLYPWIRLVSPTGAIVAENDSYNGVVYNPGAAQITISAPTSGTYTVIVGSNDPRTMSLGGLGYAGTGDYTLTLVTAPGTLSISAGDQGGAMANGASHAGSIVAGDVDPWTFTATQGNAIVLSIGEVPTGATLYPWIRLVSPTGAIIGSSYGASTAQVAVTAPATGSYTVIVGSFDPRTMSLGGLGYAGTGDYVLTWQ